MYKDWDRTEEDRESFDSHFSVVFNLFSIYYLDLNCLLTLNNESHCADIKSSLFNALHLYHLL